MSLSLIIHYQNGARQIVKPSSQYKDLGNNTEITNLARDIAGRGGMWKAEIQRYGNKKRSPKKER